jgi:hypothetical protein
LAVLEAQRQVVAVYWSRRRLVTAREAAHGCVESHLVSGSLGATPGTHP